MQHKSVIIPETASVKYLVGFILRKVVSLLNSSLCAIKMVKVGAERLKVYEIYLTCAGKWIMQKVKWTLL